MTPPFNIELSHEVSPQALLVLEYLAGDEHDNITPLMAHISLGVASLTARIAELRKAGIKIEDEWRVDHFNRRYKTYWLKGKPQEAAPAAG